MFFGFSVHLSLSVSLSYLFREHNISGMLQVFFNKSSLFLDMNWSVFSEGLFVRMQNVTDPLVKFPENDRVSPCENTVGKSRGDSLRVEWLL